MSEPIRPGNRGMTIDAANQQREAIRRGQRITAGDGLGALETSGGSVITIDPQEESLENCMRMLYGDALGAILGLPTLRAGALVHLIPDRYHFPGDVPVCELPDFTGRSRLGILREGAKEGDCPWVQYQGFAQVYWDYTSRPDWWSVSTNTGAKSPPQHRLGARADSPFPVWDDNGPLMVIDDTASDYALEYGDPLYDLVVDPGRFGAKLRKATVAILHERAADAVFCSQYGYAGDGVWINAPYECFVFAAPSSLTCALGVVEVTI